ncbi:MAG: FeoC-like transcriptional regulator [Proteobacteria bacterium]|nr:FeoC-like transcriptional regulator [Pseudomonadota bacterium]
MILMKLRDYLKEKHAASLGDMARHFDIPESAVHNMLEHWVRKGHATVDVGVTCGGGCSVGKSVGKSAGKSRDRCNGASVVYRWRRSS